MRLAIGPIAFLIATAHAQTTQALPAVKATAKIVCDVDPTAPYWKSAPTVTGFQDISHGNSVADQTTAHVLYDADNIYILVECTDAHPDGVVGRETVRDSLFNQSNSNGNFPTNEDYILVTLDPFQTHQKGRHRHDRREPPGHPLCPTRRRPRQGGMERRLGGGR